jgi:hypothetical protein
MPTAALPLLGALGRLAWCELGPGMRPDMGLGGAGGAGAALAGALWAWRCSTRISARRWPGAQEEQDAPQGQPGPRPGPGLTARHPPRNSLGARPSSTQLSSGQPCRVRKVAWAWWRAIPRPFSSQRKDKVVSVFGGVQGPGVLLRGPPLELRLWAWVGVGRTAGVCPAFLAERPLQGGRRAKTLKYAGCPPELPPQNLSSLSFLLYARRSSSKLPST